MSYMSVLNAIKAPTVDMRNQGGLLLEDLMKIE